VGCHHGHSLNQTTLRCSFADSGFEFSDGRRARPCKTAYHPSCIRAGLPFTSRRKNSGGLVFPDISVWPSFVCEACTVRSVLDRELVGADDWKLMCFERMRLLDMAHCWAEGTHKVYQSKIRFLRRFEATFGVKVLSAQPLTRPPIGDEIPLTWAMLSYSLQQGRRKTTDGHYMTLSYSTVRQLRSAASQYMAWDMMVRFPGKVYMDQSKRLIQQPCRATDSFGATMFASGFKARIGDESRPSVALLDRHVRWLDNDLNQRYEAARTDEVRNEIAKAGLANLSLWLGWLRSAENFELEWRSVKVVEPADGPSVDLPRGCGIVQYYMQPETKTMRSQTADVVMAFKTLSGYRLGRWVHRVRSTSGLGPEWSEDTSLLFCHPDGSPWTSEYFRYRYLYPALEAQRVEGDALLRAFDGSPGNSIPEKLWSLHCYRRGARTHVSRGSRMLARYRRASAEQVYEHGRWRRQRSGENVDVMYREWLIRDRIKITLYSM
jgi:hypothetical protein